MECVRSERGSFTIEAVFVFGLILMILGGVMLLALSLHDRVLQLSSAMLGGSQLRRGTEASGLDGRDIGAVREQYFSETQGDFLSSFPISMEAEISEDTVRVLCSMKSRFRSSGNFSWLRENAPSECAVRFRRFSDPMELLLRRQAKREKEDGS